MHRYICVSARAVICQFCGPYSTARPTKYNKYLHNVVPWVRNVSYGPHFFSLIYAPWSVNYSTDLELGQSEVFSSIPE